MIWRKVKFQEEELCQRGERGNSEMKKMRSSHSNNSTFKGERQQEPIVSNLENTNTKPIGTISQLEETMELKDMDHPCDILQELNSKLSESKEDNGIDYIYQTIRSYNRKQYV